jgi:hypothetical protein
MSTTTDMRDAYIAAELAVLKGQSFRMGDRMLTRSDIAEIRAGRREWEQRANNEASAAAGRRGPLKYASADFSGCE